MAIDYSTDALIASVRRRITLPDAQNLYTPTDIIGFANDEMASTIIPLIHSVQQEYWVQKIDVPLVQNQTNYTIPVRGIINGLRLISLVDTAGNEIAFPRLQPENTISAYNWLSPYSTATLCGFVFEDDHIVAFPSSIVTNPTMSVRFRLERQPNQLCLTTAAGQITQIVGNVVTVENLPSTWTTSTTFDLVQSTPAFPSKGDDLTISAIDSGLSTLTFNSLPSNAAVGDWVSEAGTAPVAQIPFQMFPYLAQCVANLCLAGMADQGPYDEAQRKTALMKEDLLKLLQPRDMGNVQTVINRTGFFEQGSYWGWTGGGWNW